MAMRVFTGPIVRSSCRTHEPDHMSKREGFLLETGLAKRRFDGKNVETELVVSILVRPSSVCWALSLRTNNYCER
jgi:hypothetical protein